MQSEHEALLGPPSRNDDAQQLPQPGKERCVDRNTLMPGAWVATDELTTRRCCSSAVLWTPLVLPCTATASLPALSARPLRVLSELRAEDELNPDMVLDRI